MQGIKTEFFSDVKMPIMAGMQFGTTNNKIKKVGFEVFRHYFDSPQKDWQVGSEKIKRILKY